MEQYLTQAQEAIQNPIFEPNFLNVEFLFNFIFTIFDWITAFLRALMGGGPSVGAYAQLIITLLWILVIALAVGLLYMAYRIRQVKKDMDARYNEQQRQAVEAKDYTNRNERWERVLDHIDSPDESDWRLGIIEADTILDDMLTTLGYTGDSIGDKLKGVEMSDMTTLDAAWEAHKVRNRIAHDGASFELTKREAQRVIDLYRRVFEEFHYI